MTDVFDDIISTLQPEHIPLDYIIGAKYTDRMGNEIIVRGEELEHFMSYPQEYSFSDARVILDVRKLRLAMWDATVAFFSGVYKRANEYHQNLHQ